MIIGLGLLAAACGGTVAGEAQPDPVAVAPPTTSTSALGRFLPRTVTPMASSSAIADAGAEPAARGPTVPATTNPPNVVVVPTEPPNADPPNTDPPNTGVVAKAGPTASTATPATGPRQMGNVSSAAPTIPAYTIRRGLTGTAALTGLPAPAAVTSTPVLAVNVDNVGSARPQWALDRADVVFEENVEGATRFLALFHSDVPAEIGSVRSARTTDIDLRAGMNRPVLGWSGGNPGVTEWVQAAADAGLLVDVAAVRSNCYRRDSSRRSPHNLLAKTACVLERGAAAGPARPLWVIDEDWTPSTPITADTSFEVRMDNLRAGWTWDTATATYLRSQNERPHVSASGARLAAANVVVVFATHVPSSVDARSPEAITVGSGVAMVHRDGVAVSATWSRRTARHAFVFTAADGSVIPLQSGTTFVELARAG